jgi:uncharacterized membrane protein YfcA
MTQTLILSALIFAAAALYGSVGHAGASGYLAAMAIVGIGPAVMKPTALVLNILAASIVTAQFYRAGCFSWATLWPFAAASVPMSFVGGAWHLPENVYKPIAGIVLLFAAARMIQTARRQATRDQPAHPPPIVPALASGGAIGLVSGLTGTGGGIFLTPLLLIMGWAQPRESAGVSAAFILVNSIAGLAGNVMSVRSLPSWIALWALAAASGAAIGSRLGSRRLAAHTLRYLLAVVLIIAAGKLIFV